MPDVLTPRSAEEAARIVREAHASGARVKLSSAAMTQIAEYEPADLVISVQAGATLADIARAASPNNQFFALDPALPASATIGSIIATNAAGPLRYAHGTPRDQVLGLEVVTGDGRVMEFGGRVVKNVAGYDIVRLMVGSRGRLGFITRVNLRLKPLPDVDRTASVVVDSYEAAVDVVDAIHDARLDPVALEIVSAPQWTVLARFHGNDLAVSDGMARVCALGSSQQLAGGIVWETMLSAEAGAPVVLRVANTPSKLRESMESARRLVERARLSDVRYAVHAGNGIIRLLANGAGSEVESAIFEARTSIVDHGGSLRAERIPGIHVEDEIDRANRALMEQITRVFDPAGIFG